MLRWNTLVLPALVGIAIVVAVWWGGPGLFGAPSAAEGTVAEATVTQPAACTDATATETVRFELSGTSRDGTLDACGHDPNERVNVVVPADAASDGTLDVSLADVVEGHNNLRRPVGLALVALSCLSGGTYSFLVIRGPRRRPALAA